MHEVAVCVEKGALPAGLWLRKTRHRKYHVRGFGKGFMTRAGSVRGGYWQPAWARSWRKRQDVVPLGRYWHQALEREGEKLHSVCPPGRYWHCAGELGFRGNEVRWLPMMLFIKTSRGWMYRQTRRTRGQTQTQDRNNTDTELLNKGQGCQNLRPHERGMSRLSGCLRTQK